MKKNILTSLLLLFIASGCTEKVTFTPAQKNLFNPKAYPPCFGLVIIDSAKVDEAWIERNSIFYPQIPPTDTDMGTCTNPPIYIDLQLVWDKGETFFMRWWNENDKKICRAEPHDLITCTHEIPTSQRSGFGNIKVKTKTVDDFKIMVRNAGANLDNDLYNHYAKFSFSIFGKVKLKMASTFDKNENHYSIPFLRSIIYQVNPENTKDKVTEIGFFKADHDNSGVKILIRIKWESGKLQYYNFSQVPTKLNSFE